MRLTPWRRKAYEKRICQASRVAPVRVDTAAVASIRSRLCAVGIRFLYLTQYLTPPADPFDARRQASERWAPVACISIPVSPRFYTFDIRKRPACEDRGPDSRTTGRRNPLRRHAFKSMGQGASISPECRHALRPHADFRGGWIKNHARRDPSSVRPSARFLAQQILKVCSRHINPFRHGTATMNSNYEPKPRQLKIIPETTTSRPEIALQIVPATAGSFWFRHSRSPRNKLPRIQNPLRIQRSLQCRMHLPADP